MNWIKNHKFLTAILVVVALIVIGNASSSSSSKKTDSPSTTSPSSVDSNNSGNHAAAADVVLSKCANGPYNMPDVKATITNHTSKRSNYLVEVTLLDSAGNKVGDGVASSNNVEPGQTAYEDVLASSSNGSFSSCHVVSVTRYAA